MWSYEKQQQLKDAQHIGDGQSMLSQELRCFTLDLPKSKKPQIFSPPNVSAWYDEATVGLCFQNISLYTINKKTQ